MAPRYGRLFVPCVVAGFALLALACGGGGDEAPEAADTASQAPFKVEKGIRELTMPGKQDESVTAFVGSGELPDGYPSDIPPPSGAEPHNVIVVPGQSGLVTFISDLSRDDVFAHYKNSLEAEGWQVETEENEQRALVKAVKGKRTASVNIAKGKSGTEIVVAFQESS